MSWVASAFSRKDASGARIRGKFRGSHILPPAVGSRTYEKGSFRPSGRKISQNLIVSPPVTRQKLSEPMATSTARSGSFS